MFLEADSFHLFLVEAFAVAVTDEHREHIFVIAVQDGVDGKVPGDVLNLTSAEVILRG